ncbi:MAG: LLM class flavin-dependent oxidoreductase, partial [Chloroflexi bacterium]|nr:LLM class flavin-dependent oxidoreductase [Chloroflexota bacterium]
VMNRHPALLARMAGTVQALSGGRLTLGIGIGGGKREHEAYGMDFPEPAERARRLEEAVGVLRALWTGGPVSLDGEFYHLRDAVAHPIPDPAPRILIGAESLAGVGLAARVGDGWAPEDAVFASLHGPYLDALAAAGRQREDVAIVVGMGSGRSYQDNLVGGPWVSRPREESERWRRSGRATDLGRRGGRARAQGSPLHRSRARYRPHRYFGGSRRDSWASRLGLPTHEHRARVGACSAPYLPPGMTTSAAPDFEPGGAATRHVSMLAMARR